MKKFKAFVLVLGLPVLLAACAHFSETSFGHYSEAEKYYAKGDFKKAIAEYGDYLKQEPEGNMAIIARYYIAKSRAALGNVEEARADYQGIIEKYPKSDWARFSKTRLEELAAQK